MNSREHLNSFCKCEDIRHSSRCSNIGSTSYDTLSGYAESRCGKKVSWHYQPIDHGVVCMNLCFECARRFKNSRGDVKPYDGIAGNIEADYVRKSPISWKTFFLILGVIGYVIYSYIRY